MDLRRKIVEAVWRGMSKAQATRAFGVGGAWFVVAVVTSMR